MVLCFSLCKPSRTFQVLSCCTFLCPTGLCVQRFGMCSCRAEEMWVARAERLLWDQGKAGFGDPFKRGLAVALF